MIIDNNKERLVEVQYKDLSTPLQITLIALWICMGIYALLFTVGLIAGLTGTV